MIFHNFSKYDAHLFIKELTQFESDQNIQIIPSNTETYISVSKSVKLGSRAGPPPQKRQKTGEEKQVYLKIEFKDSFRFLSASIDALAKSLDPTNDFKNLQKHFPVNSDMLKRKGVFPYELVQTDEDYQRTDFPEPSAFSTCLNDYEPISEEDYRFAKDVYEKFECNTLGDYSDLYLKTDVCILADIFEKFRAESMVSYGLDPVHFYTSPGLAWISMLKLTEIEIELISDLDMLNFFKAGIRGGLSQCSLRKAVARNKYTHPNEEIENPSYLMYLDINNLYGWAMCEKLPVGEYEWLSEENVERFDVTLTTKEDDYGYVCEVDIEYPYDLDLHEDHNDLPFLPERKKTTTKGNSKLVTTLQNKEKYVVHSANLKQAVEHGVKVKKFHRILRFKQEAWMKPYIELNNRIRSIATSKTAKDLAKLMNNSVFGKTIENVLERRVIRLFDEWENKPTGKRGAQSFVSSGYLKRVTIFDESCVAVELEQKVVKLNKPIQIGFAVLELAKTKVYEFHYDLMKKLYPSPKALKLAYTDTDSLIYQIFTKDLYEDLKPLVHNPQRQVELFDTSDYPINNQFGYQQVNKKVLGAMKDECAGKLMTEFIGLRAKCYSFKILEDDKWQNKAKGTKKHVAKLLKPEEYEACLLDREKIIVKNQHVFRSHLHNIYTEELRKSALNGNDDKRFIRNDGVNTYAWGHCGITLEEASRLTDSDIEMLENEFLNM